MSIEEEQQVRHCLSEENFQAFRQDQVIFYGKLLSIFGLPADRIDPRLFGNLALAMMMVYKAIPDTIAVPLSGGGGGHGGIPGQGPGRRVGAGKRECTTGKSRCIAVGFYVQMDTKDNRILSGTGLWKTGLGSVRPFHALRQSVLAAVWHGAFFMTQKEVG